MPLKCCSCPIMLFMSNNDQLKDCRSIIQLERRFMFGFHCIFLRGPRRYEMSNVQQILILSA